MLALLPCPRHIGAILPKGPTVTDLMGSALADALRDRYVLERIRAACAERIPIACLGRSRAWESTPSEDLD